MFIQRATETDAKVTVELIKALLDELDGKPVEWDLSQAEKLCREMIAQQDYVVFHSIDDNDRPAGVITIAETDSLYAGGKIGLIQELYITPAMRCQNIGQSLIQKAIDHARDKQWNRLEVGAPAYPQWQRTKAFYIKEGFKEIGPRLKYEM
jgi:GNAT superfamily N-acetyltransferase